MMWKWWVEKSDVTIRRIRRCGGGSQPNILPPPFSSLLHNHCSTHCKQTQIQATTTMYVWPKWTKHHSHQDHSLFHIHYEFFYLPSLYYVCVFGGPLLESCTGGKRQIQARFHSHKRSLSYNIHQTLQELIMCNGFNGFNGFRGIGVQPRPADLRLASQCRL